MTEQNPTPPPPAAQPAPAASGVPQEVPGKKVAAGVLGILLGALGIHKFILGYTKEGLIMLLVSIVAGIVTLGLAWGVMAIIGLVEGILYLTKSDQEFYTTYIQGNKGWF
ncbi:MAG: TM2 domain-containing protein [Opitutales bacterium]